MEPWVTLLGVPNLHMLPVGLTQQGLQGEASHWKQCSHWHETGYLASFSILMWHDGWLD